MDRRLLVLRHAKSSWNHSGFTDHERPLSGRGHKALPRLRRALEQRAPNIEVVLCSSAVRTVATLEGVRAALADHVQVTIDELLYDAGGQTWFVTREQARTIATSPAVDPATRQRLRQQRGPDASHPRQPRAPHDHDRPSPLDLTEHALEVANSP